MMPKQIDFSLIPIHCRSGVEEYVLHGHIPGGFLTNIFQNDFVECFAWADEINQMALRDYANFLHNKVPRNCWGNEEAMIHWKEVGGLRGLEKKWEEEAEKRDAMDKHLEDNGQFVAKGICDPKVEAEKRQINNDLLTDRAVEEENKKLEQL